MKVVVFFVLLVLGINSSAQNLAIGRVRNDGMGSSKASRANEDDKRIEMLQAKLKCYRCCVGELKLEDCQAVGNFRNCGKKKNCSCE